MSAATQGRLDLILTDLRLPTVKRLALELCAQSDREGWPGNRLLEALFEHEINERDVRRIERHRAESALTPDKRLSSFDFSAVPSVSIVEAHEEVMVPAGTFKTFRVRTIDSLGNDNVIWFSPKVGLFVKAVFQRTEKHPQGPGRSERQLMSVSRAR